MSPVFFCISTTCLYSLVQVFISAATEPRAELDTMALSCNELAQASTMAISSAAAQIARLTGSLRRCSSAACDSASRLRRIGIGQKLECGDSCADGDGQLGRDLFEFAGLLRRQFQFHERAGIPCLGFDHEFLLQSLHNEFRPG